MKFDIQDVRPVAEEVAEDYPGRTNEDCYYSEPCLVGEILARLSVPVPDSFDGTRFSRIPWARVSDASFTTEAVAFLQKIQDLADLGGTWDEAVSDG